METDFLSFKTATALRLVFDTAALVLIWLVQLVIYPAFLHFRVTEFRNWHPSYTRRVTYVVLPVMLGQLALYGFMTLIAGGWDVWLNLSLILLVWAVTSLRAVPLHASLNVESDHLPLSRNLLAVNGIRVWLWTLIWLVTALTVLPT